MSLVNSVLVTSVDVDDGTPKYILDGKQKKFFNFGFFKLEIM